MNTTITSGTQPSITSMSSPYALPATPDGKRIERWRVSSLTNGRDLVRPLRWRETRHVVLQFDLFADFVPDAWIDKLFAVMALAPQHTFQVLTKRSKRMRDYCSTIQRHGRWLGMEDFAISIGRQPRGDDDYGFDWISNKQFLPNVWLGVSAEDQQRADERVPDLLATPAAVRFLSAEPLLNQINLLHWFYDDAGLKPIDWVITGGESGSEARGVPRAAFRSIRDQCAVAGTAYLHKQNGEWIDANEWLAGLARNGAFAIGGIRLDADPLPPLTFEQAAHLAANCGHRFECQSDGSTLIRLGKRGAGRRLDGALHNAFPEPPR